MNVRSLFHILLATATLVVLAAGVGPGPAWAGDAIPVPRMTIYPGDTITDAMLAERQYPAGTVSRYPVVADRQDLIGKVARRTLLANQAIASNAIKEAELIKRGTIVEAVYRDGGLVITTPVLALQSGSLDTMIQVRNVDSGKVVIGTVQSDGSVQVGGK
jgi:flagella basal body P-ring formation protein FlgA